MLRRLSHRRGGRNWHKTCLRKKQITPQGIFQFRFGNIKKIRSLFLFCVRSKTHEYKRRKQPEINSIAPNFRKKDRIIRDAFRLPSPESEPPFYIRQGILLCLFELRRAQELQHPNADHLRLVLLPAEAYSRFSLRLVKNHRRLPVRDREVLFIRTRVCIVRSALSSRP